VKIESTRIGEYELRVQVLHAGTRSEGRVGRLFHGHDEIVGARDDTVTPEPGGPAFVHLGDDRPHLWSRSGWTLRNG
jgi:hypothetical protein